MLNSKYGRLIALGALLTVLVSACTKQLKFDRSKWNIGDGINFDYRNQMLDDLLQTHRFEGMKIKQVTDTLGRPEAFVKNSMYYDVYVKWDGAPPSYMKRLFFHFNADSVVTRVQVYEHSEKKRK